MNRRSPALIGLLFGLLLVAYSIFYCSPVDEIDILSLFSEGLMAIAIFLILLRIPNFNDEGKPFGSLTLGSLLLFFAMQADTLDELFLLPSLFTTIIEDFFQVAGFFLVLSGIIKRMKVNELYQNELKRLAITDELTGLFARGYGYDRGLEAFDRFKRNHNRLGILMIDIDNFKSINDTYGHQAGDAVLRALAKKLQNSIRSVDTIARWGGEEFLVILTDMDEDICRNLAEKVRTESEKVLVAVGDKMIGCSVSVGAAVSNANDDSLDTLIARADKLLYKAKDNGRNCVAAEPLASEPASIPGTNL